MTKTIINCSVLATCLMVAAVWGCKKHSAQPEAPTVTTAAIAGINPYTAVGGGTITANGGAAVTASGICWSSTNNTPNVGTDSVAKGTTAMGSFTDSMKNLLSNTMYYVRAFATNSAGTAYGAVVTFSTAVDTTKVTFTYKGKTVTYGVIISPTTGRKWLDRNLGASEAATSVTDTAAYGDLFQWGRLDDGHQNRNSDTTSVWATTDIPGNGKFVVVNSTNAYADWRIPPNNNLWQGSQGTNNPCPKGWHVPTIDEWGAELGITNGSTGYSQIGIVLSGYRKATNAGIGLSGSYGTYWSSTPEASTAIGANHGNYFQISTSTAGPLLISKLYGLSIRCIKD